MLIIVIIAFRAKILKKISNIPSDTNSLPEFSRTCIFLIFAEYNKKASCDESKIQKERKISGSFRLFQTADKV